MIDNKWQGTELNAKTILFTQKEAAQFAEAVQLKDDVYFSYEAALAEGYENIPLPATMPVTFWRVFDIPWLYNMDGIIHTRQRFYYRRPLIADRAYECKLVLDKMAIKHISIGRVQFLDHTLTISFHEEIHAIAETTLMIKGDN
ncbi:FAS1-like dehydratase domain-containing protein [Thalassobacillus pellis]|uniref:FAS1-like dehydratase domain-containing protein n=1 Tax=Thalassobacillus pellis TaxID=748008 RepID=UPI00195F2882|nr:MaoC family dehydratase N-terminal domain-containing protein [Thalassobacillus pellis]MBM7551485.1 hypothetical protein [Thalassobacillus pellis]